MFDINSKAFKEFVKTLDSTKTDDDDKDEVLHLPESFNTSTKTPFYHCNSCCDKVRIHSSDVAAELYPHLLGIYAVIDSSIDTGCHPPTYK